MRRGLLVSLFLVGTVFLCGIALSEGALHIHDHLRVSPDVRIRRDLEVDARALLTDVAVTSGGVTLRAWLVRPKHPNGAAVILLHGVADSRAGMSGHAYYLLRAGYTCLLPDSRGHGLSGGNLITYGVEERSDVAAWASFLIAEMHPSAVYGLGESMGAAILLQSLARGTPFRAVVAECPFSSFRAVAVDRLAGLSGIPAPWLFQPVVAAGFVYSNLRYGLHLEDASPLFALQQSNTPVLLIHGSQDRNIPPEHSRRLLAARPAETVLWEVEGARHVNALSVEPEQFPRVVLKWFAEH